MLIRQIESIYLSEINKTLSDIKDDDDDFIDILNLESIIQDFEVNFSNLDTMVLDYLTKKLSVTDLNHILNLSISKILIKTGKTQMNDVSNDSNIDDIRLKRKKNDVLQIYNPDDFFSSMESKNKKCVLYDSELFNILTKKSKNIDFNVEDTYGNTSLYYAINSQNLLFIKMFQDKLSFANVMNKDRKTPLEYAIEKLHFTTSIFTKDNLVLSINELFKSNLEKNIEDIDLHKNVIYNYDKLNCCFLYLLDIQYYINLISDSEDIFQNTTFKNFIKLSKNITYEEIRIKYKLEK